MFFSCIFQENLAIADEELQSKEYYFQSIDERYSEGLRRERVLAHRLRELDLTSDEDVSLYLFTLCKDSLYQV